MSVNTFSKRTEIDLRSIQLRSILVWMAPISAVQKHFYASFLYLNTAYAAHYVYFTFWKKFVNLDPDWQGSQIYIQNIFIINFKSLLYSSL